MALLDAQLLSLLQAYRGHELEQHVAHQLEQLTHRPASPADVETVFRLFDPRIAADHLHRPRNVSD